MNSNLTNFVPLIAGVVVGGVVLVSGSGLQSGVAAIVTATSGYVSSALVKKDKDAQSNELELLRRQNDEQKQALTVKGDLDYLLSQQSKVEENIEKLKADEQDLETRISRIQQGKPDLEALEKRQVLSNALQTQINESKGELHSLKQQIQEKQTQLDDLQKTTGQLLQKKGELEELTKKQQSLSKQVAELELCRNTYDVLSQENTKLETKKQNLSAEIPRLEQERNRVLQEIKELENRATQADSLRIEIENLKANIRSIQSELRDLQRQVEQLDSERAGLEDEIARKNEEIKRQEKKLAEIKQEISKAKGELEELENSVKQAFQALETPVEIKANLSKSFSTEGEFLQQFKAYLIAKGLTFPERIVKAFHTSLKVQDISALVILAGISGTGKSELPQAYAEFIGAPLVMLPVQPRWDSPQDLQGFYNYIEKKYKPTELMRYLYQHQKDNKLKGRIILVLLDEMNLARVEYYFSDFLSKLETRRNKETFLEIEAGSLKLKESERRVKIPEEFLFVGTMNEDETTQSLSDKVLDRANVLTFGRPPQLKLRGTKQTKPPLPTTYLPWDNFISWVKDPVEGSQLTDEVKDYVDRANNIMESLGRPFAHRVYQAIAKYAINYPNPDQDETILKQAIADQFGQKLLPKLRGLMVEDSNVKPHLDALKALIGELGDESLNQAFNKACEGQYGQFQWKGMIYKQTE